MKAISILKFAILFFILNECSTVTSLKGVSSRMEKPELAAEAVALPEAPLVFDEKDYKSRKVSKKKPFFTFAPILFPAGFNNELIAVFHQENRLFWQNTESKEVKIPIDAWKSQENLKKEFIAQDIDAFINSELAFDGETLKVKQTFIDPVNQKEYGSIDFEIAVIFPGQPESKAKLELYKSENKFKVLEEAKVPILKFIKRPDRNLQIALLRSTVSAHLNVSSSSSDTVFFLDGKEVGKMPIRRMMVPDGPHQISYKKTGLPAVTKKILTRAGEEVNLIQEWEDDLSVGSLKIFSFPKGLKVSMNKEVKGETPFFLYGINPGKYKMEFLKFQEIKKMNIPLREFDVEVEPKNTASLFFPMELYDSFSSAAVDFWQPVFGGVNVNYAGNLTFENRSGLVIEKPKGIVSQPIIPDTMEISSAFFLPSEMGSGNVSFSLMTKNSIFTLEAEKEKVFLYKFPSSGNSLAAYSYDPQIKEQYRAFKFVTDIEKGSVQIYLNDTKVFEDSIDFQDTWKISVLLRGNASPKVNALRYLWIQYPKYIQLSK
ncbi:MAG TPA: PEGA domain-containing protein [Leptospiraceae bacterium]|nr:PEGA domain-containing protein [Leptospiraceae bacterium]HRG74387.1 PEGA domain-containing protein [Leptospiraceae bacterium]